MALDSLPGMVLQSQALRERTRMLQEGLRNDFRMFEMEDDRLRGEFRMEHMLNERKQRMEELKLDRTYELLTREMGLLADITAADVRKRDAESGEITARTDESRAKGFRTQQDWEREQATELSALASQPFNDAISFLSAGIKADPNSVLSPEQEAANLLIGFVAVHDSAARSEAMDVYTNGGAPALIEWYQRRYSPTTSLKNQTLVNQPDAYSRVSLIPNSGSHGGGLPSGTGPLRR